MFGLGDFLRDFLNDTVGLSNDLTNVLITFLTVVVVATICLLLPLLSIWLERKVSARFQDRVGPNRVGPYGLLQSAADAVKLLSKEQLTPRGADKVVFFVAPILMVISVIMIAAVIPMTPEAVGTDLSIGMLYVVAIGSLSTIAVLMGGWGSNNKYALLGAFRVIAQMISYEVPMVLALLVPVLLAGTLSTQGLIFAQGDMWYVFIAPIAALVFFISSTAEIGRQPFDLLEAESEIVAGFNIEYSGMQFAMFYLGEWLHAILICALTSLVFLGGWWGPGVEQIPELGIVYVIAKTSFLYFVHMWIRFTLPRLRIDQLMNFNWKFLVPLSVVNLLVSAFLWRIIPEPSGSGFVAELPRSLMMLAGNLALVFLTLGLLRDYARRERVRVEALVDETAYIPSGSQASAGD